MKTRPVQNAEARTSADRRAGVNRMFLLDKDIDRELRRAKH